MNTIDVHPDDLLEREVAGTLSAADARRLAAHVAHCASCRLERQLRADFDQELGLQTAPVMLQALVVSALRAAQPPGASDARGTNARQSLAVRRPGRRIAALLAVGVALSAGLAAARPDLAGRALEFVSERVARVLYGGPGWQASAPRAPASLSEPIAPGEAAIGAALAPPSIVVADRAELGAADRAQLARPVPPPAARSSPVSTSGAGATRPELPAPSPSAMLDSHPRPSPRVEAGSLPTPQRRVEATAIKATAINRRGAPARDPVSPRLEPSSAEVEPPRNDVPADDAARLFDRANAARRRGPGAEGLYRELQARFPESVEARLSFPILGRMQLDAGNAASAIASFETYLLTGDRALREQAMAGRALAWGRLGDRERECQSWLALLGAFPRSSYAVLARGRLAGDRR